MMIFLFQASGFQLICFVLDAKLFLFNIASGAKPRFCVRLNFETEFNLMFLQFLTALFATFSKIFRLVDQPIQPDLEN